jgi:hypothetical protein
MPPSTAATSAKTDLAVSPTAAAPGCVLGLRDRALPRVFRGEGCAAGGARLNIDRQPCARARSTQLPAPGLGQGQANRAGEDYLTTRAVPLACRNRGCAAVVGACDAAHLANGVRHFGFGDPHRPARMCLPPKMTPGEPLTRARASVISPAPRATSASFRGPRSGAQVSVESR